MKTHRWTEIRKQLQADPVRWERIQTTARAMTTVQHLAMLLDDEERTSAETSESRNLSRTRATKLEHQEDVYLSALREGVADLGGRLEVRAIFPDDVIELIPPESAM